MRRGHRRRERENREGGIDVRKFKDRTLRLAGTGADGIVPARMMSRLTAYFCRALS